MKMYVDSKNTCDSVKEWFYDVLEKELEDAYPY